MALAAMASMAMMARPIRDENVVEVSMSPDVYALPPVSAASAHGPRRLYRTGNTYPHSSARQRARYARQIAAGQMNIQHA
jgi:hypothetical protein